MLLLSQSLLCTLRHLPVCPTNSSEAETIKINLRQPSEAENTKTNIYAIYRQFCVIVTGYLFTATANKYIHVIHKCSITPCICYHHVPCIFYIDLIVHILFCHL